MEKLRISDDGRYFVRQDGSPFPWLADTAWTLPQRLKWDDVEYYMKKRKSQGFTVLQIVALDPERDVKMRNPAGEQALVEDNLGKPNEKYFAYLDWILDRAEFYGFYVLLLPVWGQLVVGDNWKGESFPKTVTLENAGEYGRWIGKRYRMRNNLLWCLGGDRQPVHKGTDYRKIWRAMAEGLAEGITGKRLKYNVPDPAWEQVLITYHTCYEMETGECSTMSYWTEEEAWIRFIMLQSGHTIPPKNYKMVEKEYRRNQPKPVWDGEPAYEMMPTSWPAADSFHDAWMVRKRAYFSLLAGAFGFTYGHASVWCMVSEKERNQMYRYSWYEAMQAQGAGQMRYLRAAMDSLGLQTCIPAQEIITGQEPAEAMSGETHIQAAKARNGRFICAYLPCGGEVGLNLLSLGWKEAYFWWYDPRNGQLIQAGEQTQELQNIYLKTPSRGERMDWLLIAMRENSSEPIKQKSYYEFQERSEPGKVFQWEPCVQKIKNENGGNNHEKR